MKKSNYYENKQHGSAKFPFEYYFIDGACPRFVMPAHWHKEFEIIHVISGGFELHLNNVTYPLQAGDFITVDGGCIHHGIPTDDCVYECIVFNLNMLIRQQGDAITTHLLPLMSAQATAITHVSDAQSEACKRLSALFDAAKKQSDHDNLKHVRLGKGHPNIGRENVYQGFHENKDIKIKL